MCMGVKLFHWNTGNSTVATSVKKIDSLYPSGFEMPKIVSYRWGFMRPILEF